MLFNMSEDEWDHVVAVHLKGHFNVYRTASLGCGSRIPAVHWSASRRVRSRRPRHKPTIPPQGRHRQPHSLCGAHGGQVLRMRGGPAINANCIAPVAKTRMSENVPFEIETGEPEDIAPMAIYLLSDAGRDVNAQIYTVVGGRISVWNQPMEVRTMMAGDGGWTPTRSRPVRRSRPGTQSLHRRPRAPHG